MCAAGSERFTRVGGQWREEQVSLPPTGVVSVAGVSTSDARAFATYEDFLTPPTLYALNGAQARSVALTAGAVRCIALCNGAI